MRLTLFMTVSPFVEFPDPDRVTPGGAKASGPGSQVPKLCIYGGSGEILFAELREQGLEGNRNP